MLKPSMYWKSNAFFYYIKYIKFKQSKLEEERTIERKISLTHFFVIMKYKKYI